MNTAHNVSGRFPSWVRIVFTIAIGLLIFTAIAWLNGIVYRYLFPLIIRSYNISDNFMEYVSNKWFVIISQFLVVIVIAQTIRLMIEEGKGRHIAVLSVFYGFIGLFLVVTIAILAGQAVANYNVLLLSNKSEPILLDPVINSLILLFTTLTGLITAITGFYGQIISARKLKAEMENEKLRLALEHEKAEADKKKTSGRKTRSDKRKANK